MQLIRTLMLALIMLVASSVPPSIAGFKPTIRDRYLDKAQDGYGAVTRYHSRGSQQPRAIVIHIMEGSMWGSWTWFHQVKASCHVAISKLGLIERWVQERFAAWTNGDVNNPDQRVIALMNRYGWDPNTWSLTIEHEGFSGQLPHSDTQLKATVWQVWDWLVRYPTIERIDILRHGQINSINRPRCPEGGPPYKFMNMIFAALTGQDLPDTPGNPTEIYREPWRVVASTGQVWNGYDDITVNGIKFYGDRQTVTVNVDVLNCRQWASTTANLTREPLKRGDKVEVLGWCEGEEVDGERRWWVSVYGTRLWAGGTQQKPRRTAPIPTTPDDGQSQPDQGNNRDVIPVVLNGNTYYPVAQHGDTSGQTMQLLANGNERLWAATHTGSPVRRVHQKGSSVRVGYWVKGEKVTQQIPNDKGELEAVTTDKWFVIGTDTSAITKG